MSSLAQDELGHAQALYQLLAQLRDDGRDADAIAYDRTPDEYRHARLLDHGRGDWAMTIARRYLYDTADGARLEALAASSFGPLRELVDKIRREERYHVMHATTWLERLADREGEPRERLLAALDELGPDAATVFTPIAGEDRLVEAGAIAAPMAEIEARWRASITPTFVAHGLPMPPRGPARGRPDAPRRAVPLALERVHDGPPRRPGGVVVIETGAPSGGRHRRADGGRGSGGPRRGSGPGAAGRLDRRPRDRRARRRRRRSDRGRAPPDVHRLPGARADRGVRRAAPGVVRRPGRGRLHPARALDVRADHGGRPGPAPGRRHRAAARPGGHALPVVRLGAGRDGQRVRPDAVPLAVLLPRLPPAVRGAQADLRSTAREARRTTAARRGRCSVGPPIEIERPAGSTRDARSADRSRAKGDPMVMVRPDVGAHELENPDKIVPRTAVINPYTLAELVAGRRIPGSESATRRRSSSRSSRPRTKSSSIRSSTRRCTSASG